MVRVRNYRTAREYSPGFGAPTAGVYEQRTVLGSTTGVRITVAQHDILPAAPRGFTWMLVEAVPPSGEDD
jgi:hypothetical protein